MAAPKGLQLIWNGKDKIINHHNEVSFRVLNEIPEKSFKRDDKNTTGNIIIRGDNLIALKALKPYFYNSIKCVYIDPPYNTGTKQGTTGWIYSDKVDSVEINKWFNKVVGGEHEDYSRHTKWLCMMYPRLKLLHELLHPDGVIFISIDDNELPNLRFIMDEIFGSENFKNCIVVRRGAKNVQAQFETIDSLSTGHEYILVYSKKASRRFKKIYSSLEETSEGAWNNHWRGTNRPTMRYPLFGITPKEGQWRWGKERSLKAMENYINMLKELKKTEKDITQTEIDEWYMKQLEETGDEKLDLLRLSKNNKPEHYIPPKDVKLLSDLWVDLTASKAIEVKKILGEKSFDNPKSVELIKRIIDYVTEEGDVILDSFAGSGTTGQAVLELNKRDAKQRRFILIQMDEGKEGEEINICDNITAERIRRVIKGEYAGTKKIKSDVGALGGGFRYYELNGTLKDEKGFINSLLSKEDLARFIMFIETQEPQAKLTKFNDYYKIGEKNNAIFYLIHNKERMLDNSFLKEIDYEKLRDTGRFIVVYTYGTLLDDEYLEENRENLRVMHLPNDLDKLARI